MSNAELNASNKKNAGKGNGNTVIDNHENVSNDVSGNSFPASFGQSFDEKTQNKTKDKQ